jgi:hypothetical protein
VKRGAVVNTIGWDLKIGVSTSWLCCYTRHFVKTTNNKQPSNTQQRLLFMQHAPPSSTSLPPPHRRRLTPSSIDNEYHDDHLRKSRKVSRWWNSILSRVSRLASSLLNQHSTNINELLDERSWRIRRQCTTMAHGANSIDGDSILAAGSIGNTNGSHKTRRGSRCLQQSIH